MKKVCIVGYGAIGSVHAAALEKSDNAKLYAVCDNDYNRTNLCREKYKIVAYTDFDEMLVDENIDSVHICTPHYLHFEMIRKALEAGKKVVCEKPVTMTKTEFDELLSIKNNENVCVVFQNRLNPCFLCLEEVMESGRLGKVKSVKGIVTWCRTAEYYSQADWRGRWSTEGGGVLINQAVHTLDFLCSIGGQVESVKANMMNYSLPEIEVEDTCTAYIKFTSGATGLLLATNVNGINSPIDFEVIFDKGVARYNDGKLYINGELKIEDSTPMLGKTYWGKGHEALAKNYYDFNNYFTPHDVKNTMNTMFAIYESAKQNGKEVAL